MVVCDQILGAISLGLGNNMGIRACMLRHKEPRPRVSEKKAGGGWHGGDDGESSGEDEVRRRNSYINNTIFYPWAHAGGDGKAGAC